MNVPLPNVVTPAPLTLAQIEPLVPVAPQDAVIIAAMLATMGWLYGARKARTLGRKQHTLNVMLQAQYNLEFQKASAVVRPFVSEGNCPDILDKENDQRESFRMVLNHYEMLAAGIRNGDFDERMVRDTQRGSLIKAFACCEGAIFKMRDARDRRATYEHFEWLYKRWEKKPPSPLQKAWEFVCGHPHAGTRVNHHD